MTALPTIAQAEPILQLYVEGGSYDADTQTWVVSTAQGQSTTVWVIGNVGGNGGQGTISDVNLAVAYDHGTTTPAITLTSTTTGSSSFVDNSTSAAATLTQTVTNGSAPTLANGASLAGHGIYGAGTDWQEFSLGNFTLRDSPIADFQNAFPTTNGALVGQINAYDITFSGTGTFHLDAYGAIRNGRQVRFAPFSHDAEITSTHAVPELAGGATGGSALALLLGSVMLVGTRRRRA